MSDTSYMVYDYPEPQEDKLPCCPWCGEPTDTVYCDRNGNLVGCPECIDEVDAKEVIDEW